MMCSCDFDIFEERKTQTNEEFSQTKLIRAQANFSKPASAHLQMRICLYGTNPLPQIMQTYCLPGISCLKFE